MSSEVALEHRRFTADEVARIVEAGILREDEPVELIGGELIVVSPQGPLHTTIVQRVNQRLSLLFGERAHTRVQFPIHVPPDGLPEPDLAVVRGAIDDYAGRHLPCIGSSTSSADGSRFTLSPKQTGSILRHDHAR